jgi:multicomponent Na+:H+ antiporter subunit A
VPVFALSLMLIALVGPLMAALKPHRFRHSGWFAALAPALVFGWLLLQAPTVAAGNVLAETHPWVPELGLELSFRLDGLSLLFALIVTGIGAAIAVYTGYYFEDDARQGHFNLLLFLFMASMLGLVLSDNLLGLFCFWEGTSITSYLLIAFKTTSSSAREGGRRAFIVTGLGGLAMLAGMILLGTAAGTFSISGILAAGQAGGLVAHPYITPALLLVFLGAFTKSAQFPFHFWLPGAMSAPTPASAYLHSATMVKAGIFLLARLHPALHNAPIWTPTLITIGGITMLLGAVSALRYSDMKALLAYATVSWLGVLTLLLGMPVAYAPMAVAMGVLAHALYKGPLFLAAGIVDHATGTRDVRRLAGLARPLPWVAAVVVVAGLSMAGVPPLLGFVAKELLLESAHKLGEVYGAVGEWGALLAAVIMAALTVGVAIKLVYEPFVRSEKNLPAQKNEALSPLHVHHKPHFAFVLPALVIALLGALLPFVLGPLGHYVLEPAANAIAGGETGVELALWHGFNFVFAVSMTALALGVGVFLLRAQLFTLINRLPEWLSGLAAFNRINKALVDGARWLTRAVQGGTMASQVSVTLLAAAGVAVLALARTQWLRDFHLNFQTLPSVPEVVLAIMAMIAAVATVRARNRLSAIISLGVVGVTVTLYFIFFSAPDLALTQLLIELLTVVLLVLVFFRVKPDRLPRAPRRVLAYQIFVAAAMGLFGFTLVLLNAGIQVAPTISPYFSRFSVAYGKGGNIVNVILVDFRGYDTLGEMTVLAIAAIGGFALLRAPGMAALQRRLVRRLARNGAPIGAAVAHEDVAAGAAGAAGAVDGEQAHP